MQSHMVIFIAYCIGMKKDHQTLLNFTILAGKWQKRTFSYKVACKKFSWSGQGRGHHTVPPLKYATVCTHLARYILCAICLIHGFCDACIYEDAVNKKGSGPVAG